MASLEQVNLITLSLRQLIVATAITTFHAIGLFLYPLKTSDNICFYDIFEGYGKKLVALEPPFMGG